jgi:hypothetical protein
MLALFIPSKSTQTKVPSTKTHLPESVIRNINLSLDVEGENRWANWKASYLPNDRTVLIRIAADPSANEIALNGYCVLIKDIVKEHANEKGYSFGTDYKFVGRILQFGEVVKRCY